MSLDFITINGHNSRINYTELERTFRNFFSSKCTDVKIFIINEFPICISNETSIDLIIVLAIKDIRGNYLKIKNDINGKAVYFHNQIIPITFMDNLNDDIITIDKDNNSLISNNDINLDYSSEINSTKYGLQNYLINRCNFIKEDLFVTPLVYIQNPSKIYLDNYIVSEYFNFDTLINYFRSSTLDIFISYKNWKQGDFYDHNLNFDIQRIIEQASLDSTIGFLTKNKIERFSKQLSSNRKIFNEIGKQMTIISGKAGTGKSSELLLIALRSIKENKKVIYLTYNKLLVNDISLLINNFKTSNKKDDKQSKSSGNCSVYTLHSYFYKLSKDLGVLDVLSHERISFVLSTLKFRLNTLYVLIKVDYLNNNVSDSYLKDLIQSSNQIDIATKEVGINLINFLIKKRLKQRPNLKELMHEFLENRQKAIMAIEQQDVFLSDYYGVLENVLLQIQDSTEFYTKYNLDNKYQQKLELESSKLLHLKLDKEKFLKNISTKIRYRRLKDIVLIDEAQDCHRLEKDILISLYGSEKLVLVNGGKEQLIRHTELCNWKVSQSKKLNSKVIKTYNKSFRTKEAPVNFCNFFANKFQIDLNLIPLESEDSGEVIFDFRKHNDPLKIEEVFNELNIKGIINKCNQYESLMILLDSHTQQIRLDSNENDKEKIIINEFNNIEYKANSRSSKWLFKDYFTMSLNNKFDFWDGTILNKNSLAIPTSLENRLIYYESCRGLESWGLACFAADNFFTFKKNEEEADKFLLENLFLSQDLDLRKNMYAATWLLMAFTRVIDTLYIQIEDPNSDLAKIIKEYIKLNKDNSSIRVLID